MSDKKETDKNMKEEEKSSAQKIMDSLAGEEAEGSPVSLDLDDDAHNDELYGELQAAQALAKENWDKFVRLQAEMANMKRRHESDLAKAHKFATQSFVESLLDVPDSLELALNVDVKEDSVAASIHEGIELTLNKIQSVFTKFNITQIDPVGEPFDPQLHEAMSMQQTDEAASGTVLAVMQKGYLLHGRLIRPARVIVAK